MISHKEKILKHYEGMEGKAGEYLLALRALLEKYEEEDCFSYCPLCEIELGCDDCPWYVLAGTTCTTMDKCLAIDRVSQRKAQLKRWIKSYEAAIKKLKKEA